MKKILLFMSVLLLSFSLIHAQSITVTSPNGGEEWAPGSTHNITWAASGLSNNVKITLWKGGASVGTVANNVNPAAGSFAWVVGSYTGGTAVPGNDYKIKIKEIGTPVADESNGNFKIIAPSINVTAPSGGTLTKGSSTSINWTAVATTNNFKITLWKDGAQVGVINNDVPAGNGSKSLTWTVGNYNGGTAANGSGYKIKVKEKGATGVSDMSSNPFTIGTSSGPAYSFEVYQPTFNSKHCTPGGLVIKWRNKLMLKGKYAYPLSKKYLAKKEMIKFKRYVKIEFRSVRCPKVLKPFELKTFYRSLYPEVEKQKMAYKLIDFPWESLFPKWNTIAAKALDTGTYNWVIPKTFKKGCYQIKVTKLPVLPYMEAGKKLVSATSKTFHLVPCLTPELIEKIKLNQAIIPIKEKRVKEKR